MNGKYISFFIDKKEEGTEISIRYGGVIIHKEVLNPACCTPESLAEQLKQIVDTLKSAVRDDTKVELKFDAYIVIA